MVYPVKFQPGSRLVDGSDLNVALAQPGWQSSNSLTALAGGAQAGATQLNAGLNLVTSVVTTNDSVQLPSADGSAVVVVRNAGGNTMTVYGKNGASDTINGTAGSTGITVADAKTIVFFSFAVGKWYSLLGA
jgi:hypothetical protein